MFIIMIHENASDLLGHDSAATHEMCLHETLVYQFLGAGYGQVDVARIELEVTWPLQYLSREGIKIISSKMFK